MGKAIGILGGGQLGRMTAAAAAKLGVKTVVYCKSEEECGTFIAWKKIIADYDNEKALLEFASLVDVITCEWESVDKRTLEFLERLGRKPVNPSSLVFATAQDRLLEKRAAQAVGMETAKFWAFQTPQELHDAGFFVGFPAIMKTRFGGYDGKGQRRVKSVEEARRAWEELGHVPCILEAFVNFKHEASIMVYRNSRGKTGCFPMVVNTHENGILRQTLFHQEAFGGAPFWTKHEQGPKRLAEQLKLVGLTCVELFFTQDEKFIFNEMAPRPHNSYHWTIEGCNVSQFEQLVRILADLPLVEPYSPFRSVTMTNLLGHEADKSVPALLSLPKVSVTLYDKPHRDPKPGEPPRKRGHWVAVEPYHRH